MTSKNYKSSGYSPWFIFAHHLMRTHVVYRRRSGLVRKGNYLRLIYLIWSGFVHDVDAHKAVVHIYSGHAKHFFLLGCLILIGYKEVHDDPVSMTLPWLDQWVW